MVKHNWGRLFELAQLHKHYKATKVSEFLIQVQMKRM